MPTRQDQLTSIAKDYGLVRLAKFILDEGAHGISEHEFTALVTEACTKKKAKATPLHSVVRSPHRRPKARCSARPSQS